MTEQIIIIGSGPAGGALMNTTEVGNFPGFPAGIQGPELMDNLQEQAERLGARIIFDDVTAATLTGSVKTVTTAAGERCEATAVILATGSAYKEFGLPEEKKFLGHGLSMCATCDGFFFREQDIVVVGGGDSAMEEATFLTRFAKSVTLIVRRDELRASKIMAQRAIENPKIRIIYNSAVTGVFVAVGHLPRTELVAGQVELDENGYIRVKAPSTHTNLEGVFACGDAVDCRGRQAITAAGTGCAAGLDPKSFLAALDDRHSTTANMAVPVPA